MVDYLGVIEDNGDITAYSSDDIRKLREKIGLTKYTIQQDLHSILHGRESTSHKIEKLRQYANSLVCMVCGKDAPLVDNECPDCRH